MLRLYVQVNGQVSAGYLKIMDCFQGPEVIESTVHYFQKLDPYKAINLFKLHPFHNL